MLLIAKNIYCNKECPMSIEKIRTQIIASVWQAIAQSKVDLSSVPDDQQNDMVKKIADNVMIAMDDILDEEIENVQPQSFDEEYDEPILWKGRPFLSIVEDYLVTNERIKIITGFLSRHIENFELIRVQDIDYKQGITERILGLGDIIIQGHDPSDPRIVLRNVRHPEDVYETLRKAWLEARKRHGLQFREFM